MGIILQHLVNGLAIGSVYALIAVGYTLIYGTLRFINFAHGNILTIGVYAAFFSLLSFHLPFPLGLLIALATAGLAAVLTEKIAYKPLREREAPQLNLLITSVGISLLIENSIVVFFSADFHMFPQVIPVAPIALGAGANVAPVELWIMGVAVTITGLLTYIVLGTKTGLAMRALSADREASALQGVNTNSIISWAFLISGLMASAAGILVGIKFTVNPFLGSLFGTKAFIAAIIGGISSIPGAYLGGFLIGFLETFVAAYVSTNYRDVFGFGILILMLLVRPWGLLGRSLHEKV